MANEFIKPTGIIPAVLGTIANPDEYNQNIAAQSKDSILGIDVDGDYKDADIGDETKDSLVTDLKMREADGAKVKIYDASNVLQKTTNLSQATEGEAGVMPIASQAEVDAGTETEKAVTPATLANATTINPDLNANLVGKKAFSTSGTWIKPASVNAVLVEVISGGGGAGGGSGTAGGGGFSGGGGAGGYSIARIASGIVGNVTVTIGSGGAGGANGGGGNGTTGTSGGSSSFGAFVSVSGGGGGQGAAFGSTIPRIGGAGGVGTDGDTDIDGGAGGDGINAGGDSGGGSGNLSGVTGNFPGSFGSGGTTPSKGGGGGGISSTIISNQLSGNGGNANSGSSSNGFDATEFGGGGGGVNGTGNGGAGSDGIVIVHEYIL